MLDLNLQSGKILALQGDKATVSMLLLSMAVKLQARSKVLYIDSANTFNPFFVGASYHKTKINVNKIMIARPFTAEQLEGVVAKLDNTLTQVRSKVVIISALDVFFVSDPEDFPGENELDRMALFSGILSELCRVARRHDAVVLVGLSNAVDDFENNPLRGLMKEAVDICCRV